MSDYGQVTKSHTFQGFAKFVFWLHTARTESPDTPHTSERLQFPWLLLRTLPDTTQTSLRHPPDCSRQHDMSAGTNRCKQTPPDTARHRQKLKGAVWVCLVVSVGVCGRLLACCVPWSCLGGVWVMYGWCLGVLWVVFVEIGGAQMR